MIYILYSPPYDVVREAYTKKDGTVVPEIVFHTDARALYRIRGLPDRRYRSSYPEPKDESMYLAKFHSLTEAKREREALERYCGERFEIRTYIDGKLGDDAI